jgi:uncharacterized metal-binding protein YceD (DUF177 family)
MDRPEFSRVVPVDRLGIKPQSLEIEAGPAERRALAERFDLVSIDRLVARANLRREGALIRLEAELEADVTQTCVVTLAPVPAHVLDTFEEYFGAPEAVVAWRAEHCDADETDEPLPLDDGGIDVGEAVAQNLALALDPFPRADGAAATDLPDGVSFGEASEDDGGVGEGSADAPAKDSPFAALAALKKR